MKIEQIMSQPAICCSAAESLTKAAQLMWDQDCGAIMVTGEDETLIGVITDRDICMSAYTQGKPLSEIPVSAAMQTNVHACRPEDAVEAAEKLMSEHQIRRIPVVDGARKPIGIVSINDLARSVGRVERKDGAQRALLSTIASICEPRTSLSKPMPNKTPVAVRHAPSARPN